jgi:hypothetical protein
LQRGASLSWDRQPPGIDLAKENLGVVVPNKGFRVTVVDEEQLDQITAIRRLLEPPVGTRAGDLANVRKPIAAKTEWAQPQVVQSWHAN